MRDRTEGNTMAKVWRQVQESHCVDYLKRKDIYTTLLTGLAKPGGIVSALGHRFQPPPKRKELPSPKLLRHAFMLGEAEQIGLQVPDFLHLWQDPQDGFHQKGKHLNLFGCLAVVS